MFGHMGTGKFGGVLTRRWEAMRRAGGRPETQAVIALPEVGWLWAAAAKSGMG